MPGIEVREAKRRMRREVVARITMMDPGVRDAEQVELERLFRDLPGLEAAEVVLLYLSHLPEEVGTAAMIRWSLEAGKTVACPRVDREARMLRLHRLEQPGRDLVPGAFGIPEPSPEAPAVEPDRVDWALVPGIAFDDRGYRLGRGAGYYDRLLPTLRPEVPRWALIYRPQWVETVPVEPHDRRLDGIADASGIRLDASGSRPPQLPPDDSTGSTSTAGGSA